MNDIIKCDFLLWISLIQTKFTVI